MMDCNEDKACADPVQDIAIEKNIKYPGYRNSNKGKNDIALLRLASPADTTKNNVKTICLPVYVESDLESMSSSLKRAFTISGMLM
jgi:hypothetical protein